MGSRMKAIVTATLGLGIATLLGIGGCVQGLQGLRFSHRDHVAEAECTDCHQAATRAGHAACVDCHDIDEGSPSADCLLCHTKGDYRVQSKRPASYADVIFDHEPHEDLACDQCHRGVGSSSKAGDTDLPGMPLCMDCHDGDEAPAECATCHRVLRAEVAPASHGSTWDRQHGPLAQTDRSSCVYCHQESGCEDCHKTERPRSHTPIWKNSGHGIAAEHDRRSCDTCHQADQCSRCHRMRPASHVGARFRLPLGTGEGHAALVARRGGARSCRVCHEASFCLRCHPGGF